MESKKVLGGGMKTAGELIHEYIIELEHQNKDLKNQLMACKGKLCRAQDVMEGKEISCPFLMFNADPTLCVKTKECPYNGPTACRRCINDYIEEGV